MFQIGCEDFKEIWEFWKDSTSWISKKDLIIRSRHID